MSPLVASVIAGMGVMLGWGVSDFSAKLLVNRYGVWRLLIPLQTLALLGALLMLLSGDQLIWPNGPQMLGLLAASLLTIVAWVLFFKAISVGQVGLIVAFFAAYNLLPIGWELLTQGVAPAPNVLVGMAGLLLSSGLVAYEHDEATNQKRLMRGVKPILISMVTFAIATTIADEVGAHISWQTSNLWQRVFELCGTVVLGFWVRDIYRAAWPLAWPWFWLRSLSTQLGTIATLWGIAYGWISVTLAVGTLSTAVTVLLSVWLIKERPQFSQWLGIALGLVSLAVLSL